MKQGRDAAELRRRAVLNIQRSARGRFTRKQANKKKNELVARIQVSYKMILKAQYARGYCGVIATRGS